MEELICPKCKGKFKEFKFKDSNVIVDICQLCYATWFDKEEFWITLKNKEAKSKFEKQGLLNRKKTNYKCPKCRSDSIFLDQGTLPMTNIEVEHCNSCKSFLFDEREYQSSKTQMDKNNLNSAINKDNLKSVRKEDFSAKLFKKRLKNLNSEVYEFTSSIERPSFFQSAGSFFSRTARAYALILKEPEIILFSLLQGLAIFIGYIVWSQMLHWIPPEVWESVHEEDGASLADLALLAWGFVCVGILTLPIGFLTACMGSTHILNSQGKESTVPRCFKFVFPKIWSIWIFSWVDGWITVNMIVKRLPSRDAPSATERVFLEAMYYAWKVGTAGVIPSLLIFKTQNGRYTKD